MTERQLETVAIVPRPGDLVARDGLAKFGPLFRTGPGVRLGPVREVVLKSAHHWDAKSHIDFDTGRVYEYLEQLHLPDEPLPGAEVEAKAPGTRFGEAKEVTLPAPAVAAKYLLDLKTGGRFALVEGAQPESPGQRSAIEADEILLGWCRDQSIDLASYVSSGLVAVVGGAPPPPRKNPIQLLGLDMIALQVSERAFDTFSVEQARGIVNRAIGRHGPLAWMNPYPEDAPGLYTWAIQTRDHRVGLLQVVKRSEKPQSITFRYRLADDPIRAESAPAAAGMRRTSFGL